MNSKSPSGSTVLSCMPTSPYMELNMYDRVGDEEKPNGRVNGYGKNTHNEEGEE